jgi:hypothetical protein
VRFSEPALLLVLAAHILLLVILGLRARRRPQAFGPFVLLRRALLQVARPRRGGFAAELLWLGLPAALALLAAAGPVWVRECSPQAVILLDRGASMEVPEARGPRWQAGLAEARRILGPAALLGSVPDRVGTRGVSLVPVPPAALLAAARALRAGGAQVLVTSDRALPEADPELGWLGVGSPRPGGGIVAVQDEGEAGIFVATLHSPEEGERTLLAESLDREAASRPLAPERRPNGTWLVPRPAAGTRGLRLRLVPPDDFPWDDEVLLLPQPGGLRVVLPAEGEVALGRAFAAVPGVEVVRGEVDGDLAAGPEPAFAPHRLYVPPGMPAQGTRAPALAVQGLLRCPAHASVPAETLAFAALEAPEPSPSDQVIAEVAGRPLLVRRGPDFLLSVRPDATDWPARSSFPLLVAEIVLALGPAPRGFGVSRLGEPFEIPVRAAALLGPAGTKIPLLPDEAGRDRAVPEEPGIHRLLDADGRELLAVSVALLDSGVTEAVLSPASGFVPPPTPRPARRETRLAPILLFGASGLGVLILIAGRRRA